MSVINSKKTKKICTGFYGEKFKYKNIFAKIFIANFTIKFFLLCLH